VDVRGHGRTLVDMGLPAVLSQTFRTLIHSRLELGLAAVRSRYPGADILLFEPRRTDHEMFFTNVFSFTDRKAVCELGYRVTRRDLLARREELEPLLARHGLGLDGDVLEEDRDLWSGLETPRPPRSRLLPRLDHALRRAEDLLNLN
jgi:hypothetical protein